MIKTKTIVGADFRRDRSTTSIEVFLKDIKNSIYLFAGNVAFYSQRLSKNEMDTIIQILLIKKELMLRKSDFPYIYDKMLSDLITAYKERYGIKKDKKRKPGYSVSVGKLEEILSEFYKIKGVHIYSIDVSSDKSNTERIDLESDYRYLVLSFREIEEDE